MANKNPVARTGRYDIAPTIRAAFTHAIELIEHDSGKTFPQLMQAAIEKEGILAVMACVSKFTVRENKVSGDINVNHKVEILQEETQRIIDQLAEETAGADTAILVQDGPVLPNPVRVQ